MQGSDGNFYGTTLDSGADDSGTVFKMTPGGTLTTLYSFCVQTNCTDGSEPSAGLVQGTDGNFYGTTGYGGADGLGTVFKITPAGTLSRCTAFALTTRSARTALYLRPALCKAPTAISTARPPGLFPRAKASAQSSRSLPAACDHPCTASARNPTAWTGLPSLQVGAGHGWELLRDDRRPAGPTVSVTAAVAQSSK